jgi:hypothetical protein
MKVRESTLQRKCNQLSISLVEYQGKLLLQRRPQGIVHRDHLQPARSARKSRFRFRQITSMYSVEALIHLAP